MLRFSFGTYRFLSRLEVGQDGEDPAVGVVGLREAELGEDVADVPADGRFGDEEFAGDGGVGVYFGDQGQDLALSQRRDGAMTDAPARRNCQVRRSAHLSHLASSSRPGGVKSLVMVTQ